MDILSILGFDCWDTSLIILYLVLGIIIPKIIPTLRKLLSKSKKRACFKNSLQLRTERKKLCFKKEQNLPEKWGDTKHEIWVGYKFERWPEFLGEREPRLFQHWGQQTETKTRLGFIKTDAFLDWNKRRRKYERQNANVRSIRLG